MRQSRWWFGVLVLASVSLAEDHTSLQSAPRRRFELPQDPKATVISLDYRGGFTPPRKSDRPTLSILSDGTVLVPDNYGQSRDLSDKLTAEELQELLHEIVEKQLFFAYDPDEVREEIAEASRPRPALGGGVVVKVAPRIADAPTTVIRVCVDGREHEASHYALDFAASQYPDIQPLARLRAVQQQLQRLITRVHAGGPEKTAEVLALVNRRLKQEHPRVAPLTEAELVSAAVRADESRFYLFQRTPRPGAEGDPGKDASGTEQPVYITVTVKVAADGTSETTISVKRR